MSVDSTKPLSALIQKERERKGQKRFSRLTLLTAVDLKQNTATATSVCETVYRRADAGRREGEDQKKDVLA